MPKRQSAVALEYLTRLQKPQSHLSPMEGSPSQSPSSPFIGHENDSVHVSPVGKVQALLSAFSKGGGGNPPTTPSTPSTPSTPAVKSSWKSPVAITPSTPNRDKEEEKVVKSTPHRRSTLSSFSPETLEALRMVDGQCTDTSNQGSETPSKSLFSSSDVLETLEISKLSLSAAEMDRLKFYSQALQLTPNQFLQLQGQPSGQSSYSYQELIRRSYWKDFASADINPLQLENYLSDDEFLRVIGMSRVRISIMSIYIIMFCRYVEKNENLLV